jgi:MFS family permease
VNGNAAALQLQVWRNRLVRSLPFRCGSHRRATLGQHHRQRHRPHRWGPGLGIVGIVALLAGIPVGHLADRHSARGVYAATLVVRGLGTAGFLLADAFWPFVIAVCAATGAHTAGQAARAPIIPSHGGDRPQEFRAYLRALTNIGISVGALLAGWAVQVGTHQAYDLPDQHQLHRVSSSSVTGLAHRAYRLMGCAA